MNSYYDDGRFADNNNNNNNNYNNNNDDDAFIASDSVDVNFKYL